MIRNWFRTGSGLILYASFDWQLIRQLWYNWLKVEVKKLELADYLKRVSCSLLVQLYRKPSFFFTAFNPVSEGFLIFTKEGALKNMTDL